MTVSEINPLGKNERINPETGAREVLDEFTGLWEPKRPKQPETHPFMVVAATEETPAGHQAVGVGEAYSVHETLKDAEMAS